MSPEKPIQQASRRINHTDAMMGAAVQLDAIAAQLMAVQRHWNDPSREIDLATALEASRRAWHAIQAALAEGVLTLPPDVQHNLLILSVYADSKICACESIPSADTLGSLISLRRTLAGSLNEGRVAA
ncbi:MAG: flagellar biosynthesis regulator FlaF [Thiobacillus sp.]|nr:flagellar biosynthesis regulator FlaF [Thiobacillus sp.]